MKRIGACVREGVAPEEKPRLACVMGKIGQTARVPLCEPATTRKLLNRSKVCPTIRCCFALEV